MGHGWAVLHGGTTAVRRVAAPRADLGRSSAGQVERHRWSGSARTASVWRRASAASAVGEGRVGRGPGSRRRAGAALLRVADGDRRDRDAAGHLDDGQQRVEAAQVLGRDGHADDRQLRLGGEHARQVRRSAGARDDDPDAARRARSRRSGTGGRACGVPRRPAARRGCPARPAPPWPPRGSGSRTGCRPRRPRSARCCRTRTRGRGSGPSAMLGASTRSRSSAGVRPVAARRSGVAASGPQRGQVAHLAALERPHACRTGGGGRCRVGERVRDARRGAPDAGPRRRGG